MCPSNTSRNSSRSTRSHRSHRSTRSHCSQRISHSKSLALSYTNAIVFVDDVEVGDFLPEAPVIEEQQPLQAELEDLSRLPALSNSSTKSLIVDGNTVPEHIPQAHEKDSKGFVRWVALALRLKEHKSS